MPVAAKACPLCMSGATRHLLDGYDDRYACPGKYPVYYCGQCAHGFLPPDLCPDSEALYTVHYPRGGFDPQSLRPLKFSSGLVAWLDGEAASPAKWIPSGVKVLDIGCGCGAALAYHQSRGCDVYGVEIDDNVRRIAESHGFRIHIGPFDPTCHPPDFFDYVTLHQVVEHFDDPVTALRGVNSVLRRGGMVILSTPNPDGWGAKVFGQNWINWHLPYHRQFFSRRSMGKAAEQAGLTVEFAQTITPSAWLGYQWVHLLTLPGEGLPSPFWSPLARRPLPVRVGQSLLNLLGLSRVNHLLTRFFDALGIGDNWLFILKKP